MGIQFLKHLSRTRLLLHLVDIGPAGDPVADVATILAELEKFSPELVRRERWLVLNKIDLLPPADSRERCRDIVAALGWTGPVFEISALNRDGTEALASAIMAFLEAAGEAER